MKSFTTQILLAGLALILLFKGGVGIVIGVGKFLWPAVLLGGAYYFGKKAFSGAKSPLGEPKASSRVKPGNPTAKTSEMGGVIEICPHCLSEVGSCPKCRKSKFF